VADEHGCQYRREAIDPRDFYDSLASDYELVFEDWAATVRRQGAGWETRVRRGHYRALLRAELDAASLAAGLSNPRWNEPSETGFYQPIFRATKLG
jgi:CYTH domain-containing protein